MYVYVETIKLAVLCLSCCGGERCLLAQKNSEHPRIQYSKEMCICDGTSVGAGFFHGFCDAVFLSKITARRGVVGKLATFSILGVI